ncbi:hypothetical protein CSC18_3464 [Klebsiella aerogenes]|nr:hypothetical protein CSC18_3464 [Klebsiella aerogenes]
MRQNYFGDLYPSCFKLQALAARNYLPPACDANCFGYT